MKKLESFTKQTVEDLSKVKGGAMSKAVAGNRMEPTTWRTGDCTNRYDENGHVIGYDYCNDTD